MIDPDVMEVRNVQHVVSTKAVGVDDAVRPDLALNDGQKRFCAGVWDRDGIHFTASLEQPKDGNLACRASTSFAFPNATKVAFINLDFSRHQVRCFRRQLAGNKLAQLVKIQDCSVAINTTNLSRRSSRGTRHKMTNQFYLNTCRQPAFASFANHLTFIKKIPYLCQPLLVLGDESEQ